MARPPDEGTQANSTAASESSPEFEIIPPADTPEYMYPAYFSCLMWAATHDGIRAQFKSETGVDFTPPRSPIEAMIDQSAGFNPALGFIKAFVPWFNANVWGPTGLKEGVDA